MEFLRDHKRLLIVALVIFCFFAIVYTINFRYKNTPIGNLTGYVVVPVQKGLGGVGGWFSDKLGYFASIDDLREKNRLLKEENDRLTAENARLEQIKEDNAKLSALLNLDQKYTYTTVTSAEIIAKDPGNWYYMFVIDKGTDDGVHENMVVLSAGGLVGKVIHSGANYSKVQALIDDASSVSARSLRTDDSGFVKGDMQLSDSGLCKMEYLELDSQILEGDEIVTSQLSGIYPPGITIGTVKEIKADPKGLTKYAVIQPAVDFKHLSSVLVIDQKFGDKAEAYGDLGMRD